MFARDEPVLVAVSGGKDSLALWDVLLDEGYRTTGLYLDLGIFEYSVESKAKCEAFAAARGQTLPSWRVADEVGAPIPVVQKVTRRPTCSACGLSKRYLMNRAALEHGFPVVATGPQSRRRGGHAVRLHCTGRWSAAPPVAGAGLHASQARAPREAALPAVRAGDGGLRVPARDRLHRRGVSLRRGATSIAHKELLNRLEETSPGAKHNFLFGSSTRRARLFEERESVLLECGRCGQVTTGELCAFCKLADQVKRATRADRAGAPTLRTLAFPRPCAA